jgi:hypothetical protein
MSGFLKDEWRRKNASFLRNSALCKPTGYLPGPYIELLGEAGDRSKELMADILSTPDLFIGVDLKRQVVQTHRDNKVKFRTIRENAFSLCQKLDQDGTPPCAFNLDTQSMAGRQKWWDDNSQYLQIRAINAVRKYGSFGLILNHILDSFGPGDPTKTLRNHAGMLCACFNMFGLNDQILPTRSESVVKNQKFMGEVGWFEVYKSIGRRKRMVTIRFQIFENRCERSDDSTIPKIARAASRP